MYIQYDVKFGMLQVHKNEISLRKCSGAFAQLRTSEGTVVIRESARHDNDCEPKSHVRLLSSQKKIKIFQRHISSKAFFPFPNVRIENDCFSRRGNCSTTKWNDT